MSRRDTEHAFRDYQRALADEPALRLEDYLELQPEALRRPLRRLIEDWHALERGARGQHPGFQDGCELSGYTLRRPLGQGGMGSVWLAEEAALKRPVALKLLKPELSLSPMLLRRFQREAEAGGRLRHSGIVQTYAVGEAGGVHWIAQELVADGATLAEAIERDRRRVGRLDYRLEARRFQRIAEALQHAHEAGVIHRDLKPSNILLTEEGEPKVADFGLAKLTDQLGLSRTGDLAGTPYYMSPEQASLERVGLDPRSDIFSLGATLYERLSLRRPFDGDTCQQVIRKILTEDPVDPRRLRSRVPRELALICLKCLEKSPERRYPSMAALAEDLGRYLAGRPILAKPPGRLLRSAKWARRHPVTSVTAAVVATAMTVITTLLMQVSEQRDAADEAVTAAELEAATAGETLQFLLALFEECDPAQSRGREVTVREVLDRGAARIRDELDGQPELRIRLLDAIGGAYWSLGELERAEPLLAESARRSADHFGPDHPETHGARNNLGLLHHDLAGLSGESWRLAEAEWLYRGALDGYERHYGRDHEFSLTVRNNLALVLAERGFPAAAERQLRVVLAADLRLFGEDDPVTLTAKNNLADHFRRQGRPAEAEPLLREAWRGLAARFGEDYPHALRSLDGLGAVLVQLGRLGEAEACLLQANAGLHRVLGAAHPDARTSDAHLARLREAQEARQAAKAEATRSSSASVSVPSSESRSTELRRAAGRAIASSTGDSLWPLWLQALPLPR